MLGHVMKCGDASHLQGLGLCRVFVVPISSARFWVWVCVGCGAVRLRCIHGLSKRGGPAHMTKRYPMFMVVMAVGVWADDVGHPIATSKWNAQQESLAEPSFMYRVSVFRPPPTPPIHTPQLQGWIS